MITDEKVQEALKALAAEDRVLAAAYRVELRARAAFRKRNAERVVARGIAWGLAAAAAIILAVTLANGAFHPKPRTSPKSASTQLPVLASDDLSVYQDLSIDDSVQSPEAVSDFIPLTVEPQAPEDAQFIVRVKLPAEVAQTVGYPIEQDQLDQTVEADVLVGEEGVARAIRFVREEER